MCDNVYNMITLICNNTANMAKINVTSNELDQAPKTRAAGLRKGGGFYERRDDWSNEWSKCPQDFI